MSNKAPSAGQKVTEGVDRPVYQEAPGQVHAESLAAESARKGGAFASNPGQGEQAPQKRSQKLENSSTEKTGSAGTEEGGRAANKNRQTGRGTTGGGEADSGLEKQGGEAPSYVTAQRYRDPAGPHGKNLKEGGFEGSGTAEGALPEPGSSEDPTRVATGLGSQGRDTGLRQAESDGDGGGKTLYTPLRRDEAA